MFSIQKNYAIYIILFCISSTLFFSSCSKPDARIAESTDVELSDRSILTIDPVSPEANSNGGSDEKCCESSTMATVAQSEDGAGLAVTDGLNYKISDIKLIDQQGRETSSANLLSHEGPVVVQFFFVSCTTLCPILTSSIENLKPELGQPFHSKFRFISISIDPTKDSVDSLKSFANDFNADANWFFVRGNKGSIERIQKDFDAYQQNKMQHQPLTFFRPDSSSSWTRIVGLGNARNLALVLKERL